MKNLIITILCLICINSLVAQNNGKIRLSFKIILDPDDGSRPNSITDATIEDAVEWMNERMYVFSRGLEFDLVEIVEVGGIGSVVSNSFFAADLNTTSRTALELAAEASPVTFSWSNSRINIYLNDPGSGNGICSFPAGSEVIFMKARSNPNFMETVIHEVGHFFDLCHTQGCPCGSCADAASPLLCQLIPGDDVVDDTLPDLECWSQQEIATNSGLSLNNNSVLDTWHNIMSYHNGNEDRLTEGQLDRFTEAIYNFSDRDGVVGGMPVYVDQTTFCFFCDGSPNQPQNNIGAAITSIQNNFHNEGSNYVIVLEGGQAETLSGTANSTLNTPMRLTSKRNGTFTIF